MFLLCLQFKPLSSDCLENYNEFLQRFGRAFSIPAQAQFCANLQLLLRADNCTNCEITSVYDRDFDSLTRPVYKGEINKLRATQNQSCQDFYCYAKNPLPDITVGPNSVDLRALGLVTLPKQQGGCGSCWMFGLIASIENSILLDQEINSVSFWRKSAKELDISEDYGLRNTRGSNMYCSGGDATTALSFWVDSPQYMRSVETEANFPYEGAKNQQAWKQSSAAITNKLEEADWFLPFQLQKRQNVKYILGTESTPVISLMDGPYTSDGSTFNGTRVMQYLARGIAVLASMYTQTDSVAFASYAKGTVLKGYKCMSKYENHQVVFVGYGKYQGEKVWLVRNSWGPEYGDNGHFMVAMGDNNFCLERYAYAILPVHRDVNSVFGQAYESAYDLNDIVKFDSNGGELKQFAFKHAEVLPALKDSYYYEELPEGVSWDENGNTEEDVDPPVDGQKLTAGQICLIAIGSLAVVIILGVIINCVVSKRRRYGARKLQLNENDLGTAVY